MYIGYIVYNVDNVSILCNVCNVSNVCKLSNVYHVHDACNVIHAMQCMHPSIRACLDTCMRAWMHAWIHARTNAWMHAWMHASVHFLGFLRFWGRVRWGRGRELWALEHITHCIYMHKNILKYKHMESKYMLMGISLLPFGLKPDQLIFSLRLTTA